jgi:antitoxin (DNA-binding transcriptional repressor) of toxin-antitoxin stability system
MKTMTVGELKAKFSEVLGQMIETGEPIAISYGKKKEKIAAIIPYHLLQPRTERRLGLMRGRASFASRDHFSMSDEELLDA